MSNLNTNFGNLSYQDFKFPVDFFDITNELREIKSNYVSHSENKLFYGENVHYDYNYLDNGSELDLNSDRVSYTVTDIQTQTQAIGYVNNRRLFTGRGNDSIIGLGNATVTGNFQAIARAESTSIDTASADSNAKAIFKAIVEANGVKNDNAIFTARGNDTIIGVSDIQTNVSTLAESTAIDLSLATANSESNILIDVLAIGVDNAGRIGLGQGKDIFVGVANTSAQNEAKAIAVANAFDVNLSSEVFEELNNATGNSNSMAEAINLVGTIGIGNRGNIFLNQGNDIIFGLANSQISSNASSDSQTTSSANQIALATANAEAIAVAENFTIGIANEGLIATGWGNDVLIGWAFNQSEAIAEADAEADSATTITDADTDTLALSDTSNITVIGIDNSSGIIRTGIGKDRIIAYGSNIGIKGGKINTGNNNDRISSYGGFVGVEETEINLGRGHDYFQAAIGNLDPLTGEVDLAEDRTNSIRNSTIFGGAGNDTFEIGGFDGTVLINGGRDFDALRLSGDIHNYEFSVGDSGEQTLTIEDSGSILTVKSVEAIYLGDSQQALSINNFA